MATRTGPALSVSSAWLLVGLTVSLLAMGVRCNAETPTPGEAWRSSPFHGVPNAATGRNIPCVCVYRGKDYRLGEAVCMNTYAGTVVTRCDLSLNNTTWVPTTEPCNVSWRAAPRFVCARPSSRPLS